MKGMLALFRAETVPDTSRRNSEDTFVHNTLTEMSKQTGHAYAKPAT